MPATKIPPPRRHDLLMKPLGDDGQHVVKDLRTGTYFNLPPQEAFLLAQLDGQRNADDICSAFEKHFGEPLTADELDQFLEVAHEQRLLQRSAAPGPDPIAAKTGGLHPPLAMAQRILYFRQS